MKLVLSVKAIGALEKDIKKMALRVQSASEKITANLLEVGQNEASSNILTGNAADGNTDIEITKTEIIGLSKLSIIGSDVAYQEFGYGLIGKDGKNPKQPPEYNQSDKKLWVYNDGGTPRWSHGMQAQMPMYKASKAMREALPKVTNVVLRGVLGENV